MVDFNRPVYALLGLPFDAVSSAEALERLERARDTGRRCFMSTPNLNFLVASQGDGKFRDSVWRSDLSVADGMPLVWMARLLGLPLRERVSGSGLFEMLRTQQHGLWRVFFFGGGQGAGQAASLNLGDSSAMRAVGLLFPGFGSLEEMSQPEIIDCINDSGADFLVVSLGAAKGQEWICRNLEHLKVPVVSHLGAVVNFVAGSVQRAPRMWQVLGFEWLWRIKEEPQLWRRYARDGRALVSLALTRIVPLVWRQWAHRPSMYELARAAVQTRESGTAVELHLQGTWTARNLQPLRDAFTQAYRQHTRVVLDLSDCTGVDAAFCGLLMLLDVAQRDDGLECVVRHARPEVARMMDLCGMATAPP